MKYTKNEMNIEIPIKEMIPNPKNPRKIYDKTELEQLKASLISIGQITNCIIDENGYILAGHRRHFAATEAGLKTLRCDIKTNLSPFEKSALMVADNVSKIEFNAWENREAIARIYWEEFLEEYTPRGNKDKGYTKFAEKMCLSISHIKKIIESTKGENKKYFEVMKNAKVAPNTIDEVLTAPKNMRSYLTDVAIRRTKKDNNMSSAKRIREYVRAVKRKAQLKEVNFIDKRKFRLWIERIEVLGFEFGDHILEKSDDASLKDLEIAIRKHILGFYNKLVKKLNK